MNEFGIISLILGISFLAFALFIKVTNKHKPQHEK